MKRLFVIVDCSGSIVADDTVKIGQINDLLRDLTDSVNQKLRTQIVCFSNEAKIFWDSAKGKCFSDLDVHVFNGRSNLGKAYLLVKKIIDAEKISIEHCGLALISDGEATDNYKDAIAQLDNDRKSFRISYTMGNVRRTADVHSYNKQLNLSDSTNDRTMFIQQIMEHID